MNEARWRRAEPRRTLAEPVLRRILDRARPGSRVAELLPLTGGLRNTNLKLRLDSSPEWMVLRLYEHDVSLCRKEADLMRLIGGSVPVPEVIHVEPRGLEEIPPFSLLRYVEGITLRELRKAGDAEAMAQAAHSAGQVLAGIGRIRFPKPGWLGPGPAVGSPLLDGADPVPRFLDVCLESERLRAWMPPELRDRVHTFAWERAGAFAAMDTESRLVHCDYNKRNLVVRCEAGQWSVSAVLDWEFAISGTPLIDLGNFLRYESSDGFAAGYLEAGGELPDDWRRLARWIDLTALCDSLTHEFLPDTAADELVDLVRATVS